MGFRSRWRDLGIVLGFASAVAGVSALDNAEVGNKDIDKKDYTGYLKSQDCPTEDLRPGELPFCPDKPSR